MSDIIFKTLLLKGEAGNNIIDIKKTSSDGLVDTYTITRTDGVTTTFKVTNGKSITGIKKTGSTGLVDTYTITYNDGTTQNYTIKNGKWITSISKAKSSGLVDTYNVNFNDGTTSTFDVTNGMNANGREVLRTVPNINIPDNADINTTEYLNIGSYFCPNDLRAQLISSIPEKKAFCMYVIASLGGSYGSESSMTWGYRLRIFITYDCNIYVQRAESGAIAGEFIYHDWTKLIRSDELIAITNSDIDTILNS